MVIVSGNRASIRRSSQARIDAIHHEQRPSNAELTENLVKAQCEYYFSDANLKTDRMMQQLLANPEHVGWITVDELMRLPMIARLTSDPKLVASALAVSEFLEFDPGQQLLRRPGHVVPAPELFMRDLRRSVFFYGLPKEFDNNAMVNMVKLYGVVRRIHWEQPDDAEGPDPEISRIIMRFKLKQPTAEEIMARPDYDPDTPYPAVCNITDRELGKLKTCFIVFDAQSQANKAVKAYRHQIAIRSITKYEYGKLEKKIVLSHLRGEEPVIYASTGSRRSTLSFEAIQLRRSEAHIRRASIGLNPMALEFDPSVMDQYQAQQLRKSDEPEPDATTRGRAWTTEQRASQRPVAEYYEAQAAEARASQGSFRPSVIRRFSGHAYDESANIRPDGRPSLTGRNLQFTGPAVDVNQTFSQVRRGSLSGQLPGAGTAVDRAKAARKRSMTDPKQGMGLANLRTSIV